MNHKSTVQNVYTYFGEGNIPQILACLSANVDWEYGPGKNDIPWLQRRRGRDSVAGFFEALQALDFHHFEVNHILSEGNVVVALIDLDVTVKSTGKKIIERDEAHIWKFGDDGKVIRFRHAADTYQHAMALRSK